METWGINVRKYGLDLTQATLQEYALSKGMTENVKNMSNMEKTMLRYQYVMDSTGIAQGDFTRTYYNWANQVRVLKERLINLKSVLGQIAVYTFKPLLIQFNKLISKAQEFAEVILNALGKIFGWEVEFSKGTVADDLDDTTEDMADNLGTASDNAKKLKQQLQGIDELNNLTSNSGSGSGSGSDSSGISSGAYTSGGLVVKDAKSVFESSIESLEGLGKTISEKLKDVLRGIKWNEIYEKAENFGTGLASFLNGLFEPSTFKALGDTVGDLLNTIIYGATAFNKELDWQKIGVSIAEFVNGLATQFDAEALGDAFVSLVDGLTQLLASAFSGIKWKIIGEDIITFIGTSLMALVKANENLGNIPSAILSLFTTAFNIVAGGGGFLGLVQSLFETVLKKVSLELKLKLSSNFDEFIEKLSKKAEKNKNVKLKVLLDSVKALKDIVTLIDKIKSKINAKLTPFKLQFKIPSLDELGRFWKNIKDGIKQKAALSPLGMVVTYKTDGISNVWKAIAKALDLPGQPILKFANGGFLEDGLFTMNKGEIAGKFNNGQSVVANNQQITSGIAQAVYPAVYSAIKDAFGNGNTNSKIVVQIDGKEVFNATRKEANDYFKRTGRSAFSY